MRDLQPIRATLKGSLAVADDRTHGARIRDEILAAGLALWRADPGNVSARQIGRTIGLSHASVLYHFKGVERLRAALAQEAMRIGDPVIVPMLITAKHPAAASLSEDQRRAYLDGC